jgi:hypothetical protein
VEPLPEAGAGVEGLPDFHVLSMWLGFMFMPAK